MSSLHLVREVTVAALYSSLAICKTVSIELCKSIASERKCEYYTMLMGKTGKRVERRIGRGTAS